MNSTAIQSRTGIPVGARVPAGRDSRRGAVCAAFRAWFLHTPVTTHTQDSRERVAGTDHRVPVYVHAALLVLPLVFHDTQKRHAQENLDPRPLSNTVWHGSASWAARETAVRPDADPPDPPASCSHPRATPHRSPKASIAPFIILMKVSVDGFALRGGSGSRGG